MKIPFVDLSRQFRDLQKELTEEFVDVGNSGIYILGHKLESFESSMAEFCEVKHAIGVSDGSNALFLILKALGIENGDEVITATNSFIASAWTIIAAGARPVLVDVNENLNIDPKEIEKAINSKTKAIMAVHLTGRPAAMDEINEIANKHKLFVIEDAAQAIGARYKGRRVGSLGIAAGFSLHPLKNLGVYGDGGVITTNDTNLNNKLRKLRNHGLRNRDECEIWGFNSRLDTLQASFAKIKLKYLDQWNLRCREIAAMYKQGLCEYVILPLDEVWEEPVYHNFVIQSEYRDNLINYLSECGVDTRVHYPIPIHLQLAAANLGYKVNSIPKAEQYAKRMLSLPIYPELSNIEINYVIESVAGFFKRRFEN